LITLLFALNAGTKLASAQDAPPAPPPGQPVAPAPQEDKKLDTLQQRVKQLEERLKQVTDKLEESELEKIVKEAEAESKAPEEEEKPEERTFLWGALALQKLNPELSFSVDFVAQLILNEDKFYAGAHDRTGMPIREIGLHFQHVLDPYSMFKAAFHIDPAHGEFHAEEAYITWFGLIKSLSFTVGRFRQNFGVLNRWHAHDLDQVDYPTALKLVLGDEGLNQTGFAIKWFMPPVIAHANELTLEVTDGENDVLFAGEYFSVPCFMLHLKNYYDLSESTYLELGLSGMFGYNNKRGYVDESSGSAEPVDEPWRKTGVFGADLTIHWSPLQQARYRSFTWRTEYYWAFKETRDAPPNDTRQSWGLYSYLDYQLATRWFAGVRFDAALPTIRALAEDTEIAWDIVPYLTFWQSEFVYLRLEYQHGQNQPYALEDGTLARRTDNRFLLQVDFAAGPHKHEKY
jgi:hypothetical protein